jgi:branched-chain amino acid transport system substrate-binding protein
MFKIPLGERELSVATLNDMVRRGVKTVGFIGFNDSFGDGWVTELNRSAASHDIKIVDTERFARADTSVTAQVLRLLSARPDAVLIAATGTPAVLPTLALRDRGFRGPIYEASGVINNDFLRLGGNGVEGVLVAGGPLVASDRLPDSNPVKAVSRTFVAMYEKVYGPGSVSLFAGNAYDAWLLISRAVPIALQQAKPGTPQFRGALRAAIESTKNFPVTNGVVNLSPTNHGIYAADAPVVLTVKHGAWALAN